MVEHIYCVLNKTHSVCFRPVTVFKHIKCVFHQKASQIKHFLKTTVVIGLYMYCTLQLSSAMNQCFIQTIFFGGEIPPRKM